MGSCMSTPADPQMAAQNKEVERQMKETKDKMSKQVKVLLLGSGDSGKSTILKQMRLIHKVYFNAQEIEGYRQLVFSNVILGLKALLDAMHEFDFEVSDENKDYLPLFDSFTDLKDGDPFPPQFLEPCAKLWEDPGVQKAYVRGNEAALPENLAYYFADLPRLWKSDYRPTEQDIIRSRARTTGITETVFKLKGHDLHMLDVGGQKSERRKWIHCFQDVTVILFLVSLSGYDQCLVEDKDANQMQDAMAIWDSICHSQWFKTTSLILFLNKTDIFERKVKSSPIKNFFPDYEGAPGDIDEGKTYFKRRFLKLSAKSNRQKEREIYTQYASSLPVSAMPYPGPENANRLPVSLTSRSFTNATDTALLRVVMAAVEE